MGHTFAVIRKIKTDTDFDQIETELHDDCTGELAKTFWKKANALPWHQGKRRTAVRKNAVKAVSISCFYLDDESVDFSRWVDTCKSWLNGKFRIDDSTLLLQESKQEEKNGYLHTLIIPITQEGRISYHSFFPDRENFFRYIESYSQIMRMNFGLRPLQKNAASAVYKKDEKIFKQKLVGVLPEPEADEPAESYYLRIKDIFLDHYISASVASEDRYQKLKEKNEQLEEDALLLYELSKRYGAPEKWEPMMLTAQKLQYAVRAYQSKGDREGLQEISKILKVGEDYIREHSGKNRGK